MTKITEILCELRAFTKQYLTEFCVRGSSAVLIDNTAINELQCLLITTSSEVIHLLICVVERG